MFAVFISSEVYKPNIITLFSKLESRAFIVIYDPCITGVLNSMYQHDRRTVFSELFSFSSLSPNISRLLEFSGDAEQRKYIIVLGLNEVLLKIVSS